jgi:hypothetical protein
MTGIQTQEEYNNLIESLAVEHASRIEDGLTEEIARGVIAAFNMFAGEPVIGLDASVGSENIDTLDEAILPDEVLLFTTSNVYGTNEETSRVEIAIEALMKDIKRAHASISMPTAE